MLPPCFPSKLSQSSLKSPCKFPIFQPKITSSIKWLNILHKICWVTKRFECTIFVNKITSPIESLFIGGWDLLSIVELLLQLSCMGFHRFLNGFVAIDEQFICDCIRCCHWSKGSLQSSPLNFWLRGSVSGFFKNISSNYGFPYPNSGYLCLKYYGIWDLGGLWDLGLILAVLDLGMPNSYGFLQVIGSHGYGIWEVRLYTKTQKGACIHRQIGHEWQNWSGSGNVT